MNRKDLHKVMEEAIKRGVIIVNVSQCRNGDVSNIYEGAVTLSKMGIINGLDMTMECAMAKLSYLLGKGYPTDQIKKLLIKNLRGELTNKAESQVFTVHSPDFIESLSKVSQSLFPETIKEFKILPTLLAEASALVYTTII